MEYKYILVETDAGITTVTINRPKVMNALNKDTVMEIDAAMQVANSDSDVGAVILTGSADRSFVAGADINELAVQEPVGGKDFSSNGQAVFDRIEAMQKPVVAAINGFALGGGCELAMACHMRYAHSSAKFAQPEVSLGIIPGYGGTQRLPRLVGKGIALELLLSGDIIPAKRAYEIGLVNGVIDAWQTDENGEAILNEKGRKIMDRDAFLAEVKAKLGNILKRGPVALRFVLEAVLRGESTTLDEGQTIESDLFGLVCTTEDFKEGTSAFIEKREAKFTGK